MTAPDQQTALAWVSICQDALIAGHDWRTDSDVFIRNLPTSEQLAPRLFSAYLDRRQHAGADPVEVLAMVETALQIIAIAQADT